ncbi:MAG: hypothetical protein KZQ72_14385 [Candidatus Thiodiazotropha sp. (ex Cardiolucina cf. quadrata)]|nr:hypothetical protein [Candidatus Thiodiazotropha sp. (ex Cardiolucina cf. quadrata)]
MSSINTWCNFEVLLGKKPILTGTVACHNADGTSTLTMTGGGTMRAISQNVAVSNKAFVRGNKIIGQAPNLPSYVLDV